MECKQIGTLKGGKWDKMHECIRRVYDPETISPTITSGGGGHHEVKIAVWDGFNQRIRKESDTVGTITQNVGADLKRNGQGIIEIMPKLVGGIGEKKSNGGTQYYQQDRVYDGNAIAMAHPAQMSDNSYKYTVEDEGRVRVRKLTPRECWRLMSFDDEDFDKAKQAGLSDTQLYKQAGNSIVVDVLCAIFKNLL